MCVLSLIDCRRLSLITSAKATDRATTYIWRYRRGGTGGGEGGGPLGVPQLRVAQHPPPLLAVVNESPQSWHICVGIVTQSQSHDARSSPRTTSLFVSPSSALVCFSSQPDDAVLQHVHLYTGPSESHDRPVHYPIWAAVQRHPARGTVGSPVDGKGAEKHIYTYARTYIVNAKCSFSPPTRRLVEKMVDTPPLLRC